MNETQALMYANIAIWLGFGAYCFFLAKKQSETDKRLDAFVLHGQTDDKDENNKQIL